MKITQNEKRYLKSKEVWKLSTSASFNGSMNERSAPKTATNHLRNGELKNYAWELKKRNTSTHQLFRLN